MKNQRFNIRNYTTLSGENRVYVYDKKNYKRGQSATPRCPLCGKRINVVKTKNVVIGFYCEECENLYFLDEYDFYKICLVDPIPARVVELE